MENFPIPCTFDGKRSTDEYTFLDWKNKLTEERDEFIYALRVWFATDPRSISKEIEEGLRQHMIEEGVDLMTVVVSCLVSYNVTPEEINSMIEQVNNKNRKRGY